MRGRKKEEEGG